MPTPSMNALRKTGRAEDRGCLRTGPAILSTGLLGAPGGHRHVTLAPPRGPSKRLFPRPARPLSSCRFPPSPRAAHEAFTTAHEFV